MPVGFGQPPSIPRPDRPLAPWQRRIVQAANQMGLTQAGDFSPPQIGQQLTVYVLDEDNRGK